MTTATDALTAAIQSEFARLHSPTAYDRPDLASLVKQIGANLDAARGKTAQKPSLGHGATSDRANAELGAAIERQIAALRARR